MSYELRCLTEKVSIHKVTLRWVTIGPRRHLLTFHWSATILYYSFQHGLGDKLKQLSPGFFNFFGKVSVKHVLEGPHQSISHHLANHTPKNVK